jgi:hypothetical protein
MNKRLPTPEIVYWSNPNHRARWHNERSDKGSGNPDTQEGQRSKAELAVGAAVGLYQIPEIALLSHRWDYQHRRLVASVLPRRASSLQSLGGDRLASYI